MNGILLTLTVLLPLVKSYDCALLKEGQPSLNGPGGPGGPNSCVYNPNDDDDPDPTLKYAQCMIKKYSFSAFIHCAGPEASSNGPSPSGPEQTILPSDVLIKVLDVQSEPACSSCGLAKTISKVIGDNFRPELFERYLCH